MVLVIPLCLWGVKLEVNRAVMETTLATMEKDHGEDIKRMEAQIKEAKDIQKDVRANNDQLIRLTTLMDMTSKSVDEVKGLLRDL